MNLELGLIGNCQISALITRTADIVWGCFPRLDGDPVFSRLIDSDDRGFFSIELVDQTQSRQYYVRNTAILHTEIEGRDGSAIRIVDFCPRFRRYDRYFHPAMIIRRVEVLRGLPSIRVRLRPNSAYGEEAPAQTRGSNHARFVGSDYVLRLTTDASLTHVLQEQSMMLDRSVTFILGPDETLQDGVEETGRRFEEATRAYWQTWCRGLAIPFEWQDAVMRAAMTLKLSTFQDTGAVVAAMTTSIPETAHSKRNWDYRYCWLRDAYFTVHAMNRLGATRTMQGFLSYIINLVIDSEHDDLQPLYGIGGETRIEERTAAALSGYRDMGPVRVGNAAYQQTQHDVYGAVVLAATQAFFDRRLARPGDEPLFRRLELLGRRAAQRYDKPDAGIWEYRSRQRVHTYSAVMCWAACDRLARIATHLGLTGDAEIWRGHAERMHTDICEQAWNESQNAFVESFGGCDVDASLLLLADLGFVNADDPRFISTVTAIGQQLRRGNHVLRYVAADDFGTPVNAFNVCTFWYIDALAAIGRRDEARQLFENTLANLTTLGLLSEDIDLDSGELWGNFPQTYSMVGLINSAVHLSCDWEDAL